MKAYWVAVYKDLENLENLKKYAEKATTAIKKYNGKILVRGGKAETVEGSPSPRTIIIEFPSLDNALNCYNSEDYQNAKKIAERSFKRHVQIVEGV